MLRKRGNPVFLELMQGHAAARPPRAPAPPPAPLFEPQTARSAVAAPSATSSAPPASVEAKPASDSGPAFSPWSADQVERRGRELTSGNLPEWTRSPWVLVAAVLVVALIVWWIAYSLGQSAGTREGDRRVADVKAQYDPPTEPLNPAPVNPAPQPQPRPAEPPRKPAVAPPPVNPSPQPQGKPEPATVTTLTAGYNYLVVATLMKKDADEAAEYLQKNDVPVVLRTVSGKVIDPASPEANNVQWQVVVLKGYAPADLGRLSGERMALATRVQSLGRKWKAENKRAPTDFAQVFWWKFKGKAAGPEGGN